MSAKMRKIARKKTNLGIVLADKGFGEKGGVGRKREVGGDPRGMIFVSMG